MTRRNLNNGDIRNLTEIEGSDQGHRQSEPIIWNIPHAIIYRALPNRQWPRQETRLHPLWASKVGVEQPITKISNKTYFGSKIVLCSGYPCSGAIGLFLFYATFILRHTSFFTEIKCLLYIHEINCSGE